MEVKTEDMKKTLLDLAELIGNNENIDSVRVAFTIKKSKPSKDCSKKIEKTEK